MQRRQLLAIPAILPASALAQEWRPDRPITMIIAFARHAADRLHATLSRAAPSRASWSATSACQWC